MPGKVMGNRPYAGNCPFIETPLPEGPLHLAADIFPNRLPDDLMNATIGDNFNIVVGKQKIYQHPVIEFGIPHPQLREHLDGALARALSFKERADIQRGFHSKANLAVMARLGFPDRHFDVRHRLSRKNPPDPPGESQKMPK